MAKKKTKELLDGSLSDQGLKTAADNALTYYRSTGNALTTNATGTQFEKDYAENKINSNDTTYFRPLSYVNNTNYDYTLPSVPTYDSSFAEKLKTVQAPQYETYTATPYEYVGTQFEYDPYSYNDENGYLANMLASKDAKDNFVYNPENDQLYQTYKDQYTANGQNAMNDTLGQIATRTGGIASTYAQSAAAQQYNAYMQELANKVPELAQLAYDRAYQTYADNYDLYKNDYADQYTNYTDAKNTAYNNWQYDENVKQNNYANTWSNTNDVNNNNVQLRNAQKDVEYQNIVNGIQAEIEAENARYNGAVSNYNTALNNQYELQKSQQEADNTADANQAKYDAEYKLKQLEATNSANAERISGYGKTAASKAELDEDSAYAYVADLINKNKVTREEGEEILARYCGLTDF